MGDFEFDEEEQDQGQEVDGGDAVNAAAEAGGFEFDDGVEAADADVDMNEDHAGVGTANDSAGDATPVASGGGEGDVPVALSACPPDMDFLRLLPRAPAPAPKLPRGPPQQLGHAAYAAAARRAPTPAEYLAGGVGSEVPPRWLAFDMFSDAARLDPVLAWDGADDTEKDAQHTTVPLVPEAPARPGPTRQKPAGPDISGVLKLSNAARKKLVWYQKSMLTADEHDMLRGLATAGVRPSQRTPARDEGGRTSITEQLGEWLRADQKEFRNAEAGVSKKCRLCAELKGNHIHHNHLWLLPDVAAAYLRKKAARRRALLQAPAVNGASSSSSNTTEITVELPRQPLRAAATPVAGGDALIHRLHHYGVVGSIPKVAVPETPLPGGPCRQVDPRCIGRYDAAEAGEGHDTSRVSLSGIDYLSFPGLALTRSWEDVAAANDGTGAPAAKRRKKTAQQVATAHEGRGGTTDAAAAALWCKRDSVRLADDPFTKNVLEKVRDLPQEAGTPWIVASPSTLAALLTSGRSKGGEIAVPVRVARAGPCRVIELAGVVGGGEVRPRAVNAARFKDAVLTHLVRRQQQGSVASSNLTPTAPNIVLHKTLSADYAMVSGDTGVGAEAAPAKPAKPSVLGEWDPDASSSDEDDAPPATAADAAVAAVDDVPALPDACNNFTYTTFNAAPHCVLARGQVDALVDGCPIIIRAHMEYNNKDWLATMDDPHFLMYEALPMDFLTQLWCALIFRGKEFKALVARINAFTSCVIGWDMFTLADVEARLCRAGNERTVGQLRGRLSEILTVIVNATTPPPSGGGDGAGEEARYEVRMRAAEPHTMRIRGGSGMDAALAHLNSDDVLKTLPGARVSSADVAAGAAAPPPLAIGSKQRDDDFAPTGAWCRDALPQTRQVATPVNCPGAFPEATQTADQVRSVSMVFTSEGR